MSNRRSTSDQSERWLWLLWALAWAGLAAVSGLVAGLWASGVVLLLLYPMRTCLGR